MVIREAQRSFTYLHLYGYPTDLVLCNRVLPPQAGGFLETWVEAQRDYRRLVDEAFAPVPLREAPFFEREVVGLDMLRRLGQAIFGNADPTAVYHRGRPYAIARNGPDVELSVQLPFAARGEVDLARVGDELVLQIGGWRRNLVLPRLVADAPVARAGLDDHTLRIRFAVPPRQRR